MADAFAVAHYIYKSLLSAGIQVEDVEDFHMAQMSMFLTGSPITGAIDRAGVQK